MSRYVQFVPSLADRRIDRQTWKWLDRQLRVIWRDHEKEMEQALMDAMIYGRGEVRGLPVVFDGLSIDLEDRK